MAENVGSGNDRSSAISLDVLYGYLNCPYKAYLQLAHQTSPKSAYETALAALRDEVKLRVLGKIESQNPGFSIPKRVALTRITLRKGEPFIIDSDLAIDGFCISIDGLRKVTGRSSLGDFHYQPLLFHEGPRVRERQRLLLGSIALLLSRVQGRVPSGGIIYHGPEATPSTVKFPAGMNAAGCVLDELERMRCGQVQPKLVLNDHCTICEFQRRCHDQAVKEDNLSLLRGVGEKKISDYGRNGILTLTQLAHTFRPVRDGKRPEKRSTRRYYALQALSIRDRRVYVLGTPKMRSTAVRIYLDVEGNPHEGYVYLIGMIIQDGDRQQSYSFWANSKAEERVIFERFLAVVALYDTPTIYCYGEYERAFIRRLRDEGRRKKPANKVLDALVNVLSLIYAFFYFPTYSNSLKEIGRYLGCSWTEDDASGAQSIAWRIWWDRTHDNRWKTNLIEYNREDCVALGKLVEFLEAACAYAPSSPPDSTRASVGPPVSAVHELDKLASTARWRENKFVYPDFKFVNECAYFDYQRQRVFVRTSKSLRKQRRKPGLQRNRSLRAGRVVVTADKCSTCGDGNLVKIHPIDGRSLKNKRAFDLVLSAGTIKRRVIECEAATYRCSSCGNCSRSERYERVAKYLHGLMSWAIDLHIAYRLSGSMIGEMLEEFFGLAVPRQEIHVFKSLMARRYRSTYQKLLAKLIAGPVLHADETEVKLRSGKAYVWVFTSLEGVVFIQRPTREGKFLRGMLKDFNGVLVTDFYAAYDSLECAQQKCLIHLIRDINQGLLDAPYDQELQSIAEPFGSLLRSIVATVDDYGLKRRYLGRHTREVDGFFRTLSCRSFHSDGARALQKRLVKCESKLFTFMRHDGVPWNNNNAENAIKRFAYYRADTVGLMKEGGLDDYLVLLSIYMTCRYKGVSFLKFLLSKARDIDAFWARPRMRQRSTAIELYPKGFDSRGPRSRRKKADVPDAG